MSTDIRPDTDTDIDTDEVTEVDIDDDFAQRLHDAQLAYDEVAEYLDELKGELRRRLRGQYAGHRRIDGRNGGSKIFTYVRRSSRRLNGTRLRRDYPEIWEAYSAEQTAWYLTITREASA